MEIENQIDYGKESVPKPASEEKIAISKPEITKYERPDASQLPTLVESRATDDRALVRCRWKGKRFWIPLIIVLLLLVIAVPVAVVKSRKTGYT